MMSFRHAPPSLLKVPGDVRGVLVPNASLLCGITAGDADMIFAMMYMVLIALARFVMYSITDGAMAPQGASNGLKRVEHG